MRCLLLATVAVLAAIAAPPAAHAKEIAKVELCGQGGHCRAYDESDFKSLMFLAQDTGPTDPPAAAAPWYRVRFTVDEREHGGGLETWSVAYVPSAGLLRVRDEYGFTWVGMNERAAGAFRRAARGLPSLPAAELRGAGGEPREARVDEVFRVAPESVDAARMPWGWIVAGAGGAALAAALLAGLMRRRRHVRAVLT
jgi:hypothetical protein